MSLFPVYPLLPITIEKASGCYVWNDKGNRYLDLYGGHAVISIGHGHPHYIERITSQLSKIGFYSNSVQIPLQEELSELLCNISGKQGYQLFLCNSGAEANENALKLASFHNGRKKVITFSNAFHGRTSLAVAATDNSSIVAPVNATENIVQLPFNDTNALADYFKKCGDEISSVIIEGIQGVGGIRIASKDFLQEIRTQCDKYGAVFIADSVQCGYGRSGRFFSHDYGNVSADIYSMAKGMGNGFPIGGILIAPHIKARYGLLGTTFGGNHLACAAALAVLEIMELENLMDNANKMGDYLKQQLANVDKHNNVRGYGLMIGFDVSEKNKTLRNDLLNKHQIFTGEAKPNVVRLLPALNLKKEDADIFISAIKEEFTSQD